MQRKMSSSSQFFIAKGKIAISKYLKLKNFIKRLVQLVHVVYQWNSVKYKQINSKKYEQIDFNFNDQF